MNEVIVASLHLLSSRDDTLVRKWKSYLQTVSTQVLISYLQALTLVVKQWMSKKYQSCSCLLGVISECLFSRPLQETNSSLETQHVALPINHNIKCFGFVSVKFLFKIKVNWHTEFYLVGFFYNFLCFCLQKQRSKMGTIVWRKYSTNIWLSVDF